MTAWSAARLALKIVRFTPSAGSLSESASSALGEVAQPLESSSRPKTTAAADRILPPRSALQNGRTTLTFSAMPLRISTRLIVPGTIRRVKTPGGNLPKYSLTLDASFVIDELCGGNVFHGDADGFEHRRRR